MTAMGAHHSARPRTETWLTPPLLLDALGGADSFDLDPCAAIDQPWPTARHHYTARDNGLIRPWHGRLWLNPPYSTAVIGKFMGRMAEHNHGTALIFARTETDAFFRFVWERAAAVLFLKGRLNFHLIDGRRALKNAGAPSVLCAYGFEDADILAGCGIEGQFVPLRIPRLFVVAAAGCETWREVVAGVMAQADGPMRLSDLYRALSGHAKTKGRKHWREKVRQILQQGPFERLEPGVWGMA